MSTFYTSSEIAAVIDLHADIFASHCADIKTLLHKQAQRIREGFLASHTAVAFHLICWSPDFKGVSQQSIFQQPCPTLEVCEQAIAREYGYVDWADVLERNQEFNRDFENAVDAVVTGNMTSLRRLLNEHPSLTTQTSQFGHRATLLHYLGANGVESQRQTTPYAAAQIAQLLIDNGADRNAKANIYGGSTALELAVTSAHPHKAGVIDDLANILKQNGT